MNSQAMLSDERITANLEDLRRLTHRAERALDVGRLDEAAAWVQTAATFAWMNHSGVFASSQLEAVLEAVSERARPDAGATQRPSSDAVRRVLHVATQLYQTGGHTQAIRCWVEQDSGREHRLVVTRQGPRPTPPKVIEALPSSNQMLRLDGRPGGLRARAERLRRAATWADVVILHTHNYDVVPTLAFHAWSGSPAVIQVDSNDHTFWIGRSAAEVVMHMRESGQLLGVRRRGLRPADSFVLERPLRLRARERSRGAAKRALGLRADAVVVVTAADPSKYRRVSETSFLDLVVPVLRRHTQAVLVAAGPVAEGDWRRAAEATGGRVHALGLLPDVGTVHDAADIYVDSFPFASLTSLLEAGSIGNPVMTFRGHPDDCAVLGADTRGLDGLMLAPDSITQFVDQLSELVVDESRRRQLGHRTAAQILNTHTGSGWVASVGALYAHALSRPSKIRPAPETREDTELDRLVRLVMQRTGYATGLPGARALNAGLLPLTTRVRAATTSRDRLGVRVRLVPTEWQQTVGARLRSRLRR